MNSLTLGPGLDGRANRHVVPAQRGVKPEASNFGDAYLQASKAGAKLAPAAQNMAHQSHVYESRPTRIPRFLDQEATFAYTRHAALQNDSAARTIDVYV